MRGLAAIATWSGAPIEPGLLALSSVLDSQGDGSRSQPDMARLHSNGCSIGLAALPTVIYRGQSCQLARSRDGLSAAALDGRLFEGHELGLRLGLEKTSPSDAELVVGAYQRWGDDFIGELDGEFALVVWDGRRQRVLAARDPFGSRPLFYRRDGSRLILASEVKQILALEDVSVVPDQLIAGEFLLGNFEDLRHTFFAGVSRLPPGQLLEASQEGDTLRRFWTPHPEEFEGGEAEMLERFRALLDRAVAMRLEGDLPCALQLSGGLDSASIAVAIDALERKAPVEGLSSVFPGLDCDESTYISDMAEALSFPCRRFEPITYAVCDQLNEELFRLDSPFVDIQRGQFELMAAASEPGGPKLLLTGLGGDELVLEEYLLRDLALAGSYGKLLNEAWKRAEYSRDSWLALVKDGLKPITSAGLRRLYRRLRGRSTWHPPEWARPGFVELFRSLPAPPALPSAGFPSLTQEWAFRNLHHAGVSWAVEALEMRSCRRGLIPSHPFFDRRLAEFVCSIPIELRSAGRGWKHLLRASPRLPASVRNRRRKTVFGSFDRTVFTTYKSTLKELLTSSVWESGDYVDEKAFWSLWRQAEARSPNWAEVRELWRPACFELWLRQLSRYSRIRRSEEVWRANALNHRLLEPPEGAPSPLREYSRPNLTKFGSVEDVTEKSGAMPDTNQSTKHGGGGG